MRVIFNIIFTKQNAINILYYPTIKKRYGNIALIEEVNRKKVSVIDNDELVLKRSKPLKSNIHNIRKILGITE